MAAHTGAIRGKQQRGIATQAALLEAAGRVFARMEYDKAKLKDISEEAGISLGSLYFHFGNKNDVASAVLDVQQQRLLAALDQILAVNGVTSLERIILLEDRMAELISTDALVQAGIRLMTSLPDELRGKRLDAHERWHAVTIDLISEGKRDTSITAPEEVDELAEMLNSIFVGAEHVSGLNDGWATLPQRIERSHLLTRLLLQRP